MKPGRDFFRGTQTTTLTACGVLTVPEVWLGGFDEHVVVAVEDDPASTCLSVWPRDRFDERSTNAAALHGTARAWVTRLDADGDVQIPAFARQLSGLDSSTAVLVLGVGSHLEVCTSGLLQADLPTLMGTGD